MKQLVIDRTVWARGKAIRPPLELVNVTNDLLVPGSERKQCCLGIYLTACGVPDESLRGIGLPSEVKQGLPEPAGWLITSFHEDYEGSREFVE